MLGDTVWHTLSQALPEFCLARAKYLNDAESIEREGVHALVFTLIVQGTRHG